MCCRCAALTVYQRSITNSYLRSFSQLVSSVSRIDSAMQKEIYVVTPAMTSLLSAEIQAEAATAQAAMSALPYANIELAQTAAFLSRVGDYASALARSAAANGGLSDAEAKNLRALSTAASQLRERLETLEGQLNDREHRSGRRGVSGATALRTQRKRRCAGGQLL